jgi:transcriptional regulator with XRE-family HTH domain
MTRVRKYLEDTGMSVEELAFRAGVSFQTVDNIVRGKTSPRKENIDRILRALNCNYEDIFYEYHR